MYEKAHEPLATNLVFFWRLMKSLIVAIVVIAVALSVGVLGYHFAEGMSWLDAFLNASMILSGMGPASPLYSTGGKLFASFYALFGGLVFITIFGIMLVPVIHRILHMFHVERIKYKR